MNIHICGLACLMRHPDRLSFTGPDVLTFNAAHDTEKMPFSMWDFMKLWPNFDERHFDYPGPSLVKRLRAAAKEAPGPASDQIVADVRKLTRTYGFTSDKAAKWEIEVSRLPWLESQISAEDKERWPITFTERMDWRGVIGACHDYTLLKIVKPMPPKSGGAAAAKL